VPSPAARLTWLDLFRGACVAGMIETHVLNTFLAAPLRDTAWFAWLTYFDGLIAPAFLFIAGYAQGLGMRSSSQKTREFGRKLRRLAEIWLLGYALHFPAPQILAGQWGEALRLGTQVDVLQCLAVSLALLLAIERWMPRRADLAALALLAIAVFAADRAAAWRFEPGFLRGYFNPSTGSLFPLLPWAGFVGAGFLACAQRPASAKVGAFAAAAAIGIFAPGSTGFFFQRLAWLLLAVPVVQWIADRWQPRWLLFVGKESLVFYAAHLLLIEVLAVTLLPRASFGIGGCALTFLVVAALTGVIAIAWARRRQRW
jgi:uncharacterized membrane protein